MNPRELQQVFEIIAPGARKAAQDVKTYVSRRRRKPADSKKDA